MEQGRMSLLRCSLDKKCPWRIDDEVHDCLGQLDEHERDHASLARRLRIARGSREIADWLELERISHIVGRVR